MKQNKQFRVVEKADTSKVAGSFDKFEEANDYRKELGVSQYLVMYPDGRTYPQPFK